MDAIRARHGTGAVHGLLWVAALSVGYFALAGASLTFVDPDTGVATTWPAGGLGLAAFAVAPRRLWAPMAGGVFVAVLASGLIVGEPLAPTAALSAVAALESPLAAAVLIRIAGGRPRIGSVRTTAGLAVAAFPVTGITALAAGAVLASANGGGLLEAWQLWWLSVGAGILTVAPLLLSLADPTRGRARRAGRAGRAETVALIGGAAVVAALVFWRTPETGAALLRFPLPAVPMLLWCALRVSPRATTLAAMLVAAVASLATARGLGPFAAHHLDAVQQVMALQGFLALAILSTLLVSAVVSSQWAAEDLARTEAERLASVLRGASEFAIIGLGLDGRITHFNTGAEQMLRRSSEEMLGRELLVVHDPEEVAERARALEVEAGFAVFADAALRSERRDWTYVRADGERRRVSLTMTAQRDHAGGLTGFLAMALDVTEKREAERRQAASEERHRLVLANLPDIQVYLFDRRLRCVLGEGAGLRRPSAYLRRHVSELLPVEHTTEVLPLFTAALAGSSGRAEFTSSRTGRHNDLRVVPYRRPDGDVDGVCCVIHNVTERARQEQAIRRAEADLRTIFDEAPIGHLLVDERDGLIANAALVAITGYEADELQAVGTNMLVDDEGATALRAALERVHRGERHDDPIELRIAHRQGRLVDLAVHIAALGGDGHGERRRTLLQVVDVSDRKRLEERLRHLADHDSLSGLLNRRRFEQELQAHVARCRRYGPVGAVLLLDVDRFKEVNDERGHAAGDELIVAVARVLRDRLRSSDVVARIGGDEFAALLPQAGPGEAGEVAATLVDAVRVHGVTISVGVAAAAETHPLMAGELLRRADQAMYEAKAAGRDGHALFVSARQVSSR